MSGRGSPSFGQFARRLRIGRTNDVSTSMRRRHQRISERAVCHTVEALEHRLLLTTFSPEQIRQAYGIDQISFGGTTGDGSGQTIAIVIPWNDPTVIEDANAFSTAYTTTANPIPQFNGAGQPTLTVLNQTGGTTRPLNTGATDLADWQNEQALDVEWAHAIAPKANFVVIEANSSSRSDLFAANVTAAGLSGVSVVSNSWTDVEASSLTLEQADDLNFTTPSGHANVTFVSGAGDYGGNNQAYSVAHSSYPAMSPNVLSVGGTALSVGTSGGVTTYGSEQAWELSFLSGGRTQGGGGGPSLHEPQPSYQVGSDNGTAKVGTSTYRTSPDVSMVGDPSTGMYVINTTTHSSTPFAEGGTSFGSPIWAALIAIANQGRQILDGGTPNPLSTGQVHSALYGMSPSFFHDVTAGNNGYATSSGYDLATGRGSPKADLLVPALAGYSVGTQLAFASPPPTTITAGTSGLPTLTVHINDGPGNLITTDNSAVTLSVYNGQGSGVTLNGGTMTVNAVNGVATFENLWITAPPSRSGTYQLVATDGTDIGATFSFDVVAASAHSAVTPTSLVAFNNTSTPKGSTPQGGLVMDAAGNLYGTTNAGGTNGPKVGWSFRCAFSALRGAQEWAGRQLPGQKFHSAFQACPTSRA